MFACRYADTWALAGLPWFDLRDGRLVRSEPEPVPAIDVHTHLALTMLAIRRVDLLAEHERTRHYLPMESALDLDPYVNDNFDRADLRRMKWDLQVASLYGGRLRSTHTLPNLLREMRDLHIAASVLLPIEWPRFSRNSETYLGLAQGRAGLVPFASVHPKQRDFRARLEALKKTGARGVKIHPTVQIIRPDHPRAMELYAVCGELGLPVLWHCGPAGIEPRWGQRLSRLAHYRAPVEEHPDTIFILGHSGARQFDDGLALAKRYENVWLESSSQGLPNVRRLVREAPRERVLFGSDWPFYPQAIPLAKMLIATEGEPAAREAILWRNAARLLDLQAPRLRTFP